MEKEFLNNDESSFSENLEVKGENVGSGEINATPENFEEHVEEKSTEQLKEETSYAVTLKEMTERVNTEPPLIMIYSGIKENSVGFIFGPSKTGKTTFCENLGLCIASGVEMYLDKPVNAINKKVLFISLEEFYKARTERNIKQTLSLTQKGYSLDFLDNYIVVNENMPRYFTGQKEWQILKDEILKYQPGIVFIDSLSRLYTGNIEESAVGKTVMKKLRELANDCKTTIVVIHHTPKMNNAPLTLSSLAGSRVLGQDADFLIGINKTTDKQVYLKDVEFRYAPNEDDKVTLLKIDEHQWLTVVGREDEATILAAFDGRRNDSNKIAIFEYIQNNLDSEGNITTSKIKAATLVNGTLSKQSIHENLKILVSEGKIIRVGHGQYKLAA